MRDGGTPVFLLYIGLIRKKILFAIGSNHRTFATDIELFHIGWFLDNMLDTSNRIEGFNAKIKATRKKILLSSEDNAIIVLTNCCESYCKSFDSGLITNCNKLTYEQKEELGFTG